MNKLSFKSPSFITNSSNDALAFGPLSKGARNRATPGDYEKYMKNHVFDRSVLTTAETFEPKEPSPLMKLIAKKVVEVIFVAAIILSPQIIALLLK